MPAIRVLEEFTEGKHKKSCYSEDRLICSEHAIGVIDGARGPDYKGTDVVTAFLDETVELAKQIHLETNLTDFVTKLTHIVRAKKDRAGIKKIKTTGGLVFCIYLIERREMWRVGDCIYAVDGRVTENPCLAETVCAQARASIIKSWRAFGRTADDIMRDAAYDNIIDPLLDAVCLLMNEANHQLGFGAVNGEPVPEKFIECVPIERGDVIEICSDGYPSPMGSLEASENELRRLLEIDPMCIAENIGAKGLGPDRRSYDDRSYVRFSLT